MQDSNVKMTGEFHYYATRGDSGSIVHRNFCPTCGCLVFNSYPEAKGIISLNAALLDNPEVFKPSVVLYSESALSWDHIDPSLPRDESKLAVRSS